ncbi:transcription activator effector binding [Paenibacillus curdlanolyticus YK9]|uniref:Transcription activator effector binding n=1 Tax=Paenibacillus curdlanolyticus YK9 TaxID=717606 RepID=E0IDG7_9BACL|nr:GyrI-like domain-containing protein [Paenibacillus curdlanolyticus]EFM09622.1 transcription activator effector binding [Paenibacillus curdlanolyticus YK9]
MNEQSQVDKTGFASEVVTVHLDEMKFVGLPVIVSFKDGDYGTISKTKQLFMERMGEIEGVINPDILWAPWYANDIMFTYVYAVQVASLDNNVPEGLVGFTQPAARYATVHYEGPLPWEPDPYERLQTYRQQEGLEQVKGLMVLEKYEFDREDHPDGLLYVDVFGPIQG